MSPSINIEALKFPIGDFKKPINITIEDIQVWRNAIEGLPKKMKEITSNLTSIQLHWKYRPDGWNIKEVVHHCADSHTNSLIRFKLALTEANPTIKPYKESNWVQLADSQTEDLTTSLVILEGIHHKWGLILKGLTEKEYKKTFYHPSSKTTFTLEEALSMYAWHGNHHYAHILLALKHKGQFN